MAGKATTLAYGEPFVQKIGGMLFSQTKVEITSATGEYPKGGILVVATSLGLTDGLVASAWSTPMTEKKALTKKEGGYKLYPSEIRLFGEVAGGPPTTFYAEPVLVLSTNAVAKKEGIELEEAEGKSLGEYTAYIFAFGR